MVCVNPIPIGGRDVPYAECQFVRCGRCAGCRIHRAEEWANRLEWEYSTGGYSERSCFLTLTIDEDWLAKKIDAGYKGVEKTDLQKFFKRLRKDLDGRKIKYFACGEYGEKGGRPHYHAVVLGLGYKEEQIVKDNWPYGNIRIDPFNRARARYVAGYLLKNVDHEMPGFALNKPFALMSKGMGLDFVKQNLAHLEKGGTLTRNGNPVSIPRYFRKKFESIPLPEQLFDEDKKVHEMRTKENYDFIDVDLRRAWVRSSKDDSLFQIALELKNKEERFNGARRKI